MTLRLPLLVLISLALGISTVSPALGASTLPKALNLHLSDLPSGFTQTRGTWVSNTQAAKNNHVSLSVLQREGRIISYETSFGGSGPNGFIGVLSGVTEFKTVAGARKDYVLESAPTRRGTAAHPKEVSVIPFSSIGDARFGFKTPDTLKGKPIEGCAVIFHRNRYWALVLAYTLPNHGSCTWARKYAHLIDTRIEGA